MAEGLYRHAFRRLPKVFFQNEDDRALFLSRRLVRAEQTEVLPGSGIDLQHFNAAPFARIPYLDIRHRKIMTVLPYLGLALMFTAWVAMSYHFQQCYLPYQSWIFGFPNSSWSGL